MWYLDFFTRDIVDTCLFSIPSVWIYLFNFEGRCWLMGPRCQPKCTTQETCDILIIFYSWYCGILAIFDPFRLILTFKRWGVLLPDGSLMSDSLYKKLEISWIFLPMILRDTACLFSQSLPLDFTFKCWGTLLADGSPMSASLYKKLVISSKKNYPLY